MARVLAADGVMVVIAPSAGPIHSYPVDCYRFYPDSFRALARLSNLELVELRHDDRGPWNDLIGVFRHRGAPQYSAAVGAGAEWRLGGQSVVGECWDDSAEASLLPPAVSYLEVLATVHALVRPRGYLEIGVRHGASLALARCPAVGVDPEPDVTVALPPTTSVTTATSEDFFRTVDGSLGVTLDLVFIDGAHLIEEVVNDFMAVEAAAHADTVIVVDDVLPAHPRQAQRLRETRVWCGDVWKIVGCLGRWRPDLTLTIVDASPSAMLVISDLNPQDRTLWQMYNPIVRSLLESDEYSSQEALARWAPIDSGSPAFTELLEGIARRREHDG
jgi:hypothetical protein